MGLCISMRLCVSGRGVWALDHLLPMCSHRVCKGGGKGVGGSGGLCISGRLCVSGRCVWAPERLLPMCSHRVRLVGGGQGGGRWALRCDGCVLANACATGCCPRPRSGWGQHAIARERCISPCVIVGGPGLASKRVRYRCFCSPSPQIVDDDLSRTFPLDVSWQS